MRNRLLSENAVYNLSIFAGIQYVVLTIAAMFLYPGGTHLNAETKGYLFTENFLSDLGRLTTFGGENKIETAIMYFWVLLTLGAATILLFTILRYLFRDKKWTKRLSVPMATLGIFAGLGLFGIGCAPADYIYDIHIFFVIFSFVFLFFALLLLMICIYGTERYPNIYAHALLFANITLAAYILLMLYGPSPYSSSQGLMIQVVGQKIIVYLLIGVLTFQAFGAKKVWNQELAKNNLSTKLP